MMAICPLGPPNEIKPSLSQNRNASANETDCFRISFIFYAGMDNVRLHRCVIFQMNSRVLLISNSTVHGRGYLDHVEEQIRSFLGPAKIVLFFPFALFDRD